MHSPSETEVTWAEDGLAARIQSPSGDWLAHLAVEHWYGDHELDPQPTWIVAWVDHGRGEPSMLSAAIERPALVADSEQRRVSLVEAALEAIERPPAPPPPFALPPPTPTTADEWAAHLDLQLTCWDSAYQDLLVACAERGASGDYQRYRRLTEGLGWVYALDRALLTLWRSLPEETREQASGRTDERARSAIAHNSATSPGYEPTEDGAFSAYLRRLDDGEPYRHWGEVMLGGMFQQRFFRAVSWVRGQLVHAATAAPMDLRQFRPGAEPRWKWRESEAFARGRAADADRRAYDRELAGRDVLGLLSHLTGVFHDAQWELRRELRTLERGGG